MVFVGIMDDWKGLSHQSNSIGQMIAATVTVIGGIQIDFITIPNGDIIQFGWTAIPITILWIVAITNAINFN